MATASFTARPKSSPERTEPDTVQPKDAVELADEDFKLDHDEIASVAFGYWLERRDGGNGSAEDDWYRAERELREKRLPKGKPAPPKTNTL